MSDTVIDLEFWANDDLVPSDAKALMKSAAEEIEALRGILDNYERRLDDCVAALQCVLSEESVISTAVVRSTLAHVTGMPE